MLARAAKGSSNRYNPRRSAELECLILTMGSGCALWGGC